MIDIFMDVIFNLFFLLYTYKEKISMLFYSLNKLQ